MTKDQILKVLQQHKAKLSDLGVSSLAIFGSIARDEATESSDADIMVEFSDPVTFDRYMDTKIYLEDLLGCQVDLVIESTIKPRIKPYIEEDAIYVS